MSESSLPHATTPATPPSSSLPVYVFLSVLSLSLVGNVLQAWKVRELRAAIPAPAPLETTVGQKPAALSVETLDGRPTVIPHFSKGSTVIYMFRPDCHWCARNRDNIVALATKSGDNFHLVGLSRPSPDLKNYVSKNRPPFPIFVDPNGTAEAALGYLGTPQTVVVSEDGTIIHNWIGAYEGAKKEAVETFFSVQLPGLLPDGQIQ